MAGHDEHTIDLTQEKTQLDSGAQKLTRGTMIVGGVALVVALLAGLVGGDYGMKRFFFGYTIAYAFVLSIALGALFFVMIHHLTHAGWSVTVRRIAEIMSRQFGLLAVLFIPVLIGMFFFGLYKWTNPQDEIVQGKVIYLNEPFFVLRFAFYFAVWIGLSRWFFKKSVWQDQVDDPGASLAMQKFSGPGIIIFGITLSFASFDLLMSLEPHWFSTIFGVYYFGGAMVSAFAVMILLGMGLQRQGYLKQSIQGEHYHDMGKFMFAFVFFWGYIAFSQFMLIWYANIPETTFWFARRGASTDPAHINMYTWVTLALLFGHFLIPFAGLMSRTAKRKMSLLAFWCVWLLVFHALDMFWLARPELKSGGETVALNFADIAAIVGCLVGLSAIYFGGILRTASQVSLLAKGDPRLEESLAFHQVF